GEWLSPPVHPSEVCDASSPENARNRHNRPMSRGISAPTHYAPASRPLISRSRELLLAFRRALDQESANAPAATVLPPSVTSCNRYRSTFSPSVATGRTPTTGAPGVPPIRK